MTDIFYDLGIVGGGPGGYTAALHAAASGKKVILFEKDNIGGVCLNRGCIPTKSILHASEYFYKLKNGKIPGVSAQNIAVDYSKIIETKNNTIENLRKGISLALKNAKVAVVNEFAQIVDLKTINAGGVVYSCDEIICAAGSKPKQVKGLEFDGEFILSSDDVLSLETLPKSILIVGSGAIGIEWARIMSNLGVETTVVELAQNLLPIADIEVSKRIARIFKSRGIKFFTGVCVKDISNGVVTFSNDETLLTEKILVATGREPNDCGKIDGVKYIGDAAGEIQLAHYAAKQAIEVCSGIPFVKSLTPSVIYGTPEIAWVGECEQNLEPGTFKKSTVLLSSLGKACCDGETEGFIKLLAREDKIIGAHIVSPEASALIHEILIAMQNGITVSKLKETCFAHPTYSEGIFEGLFGFK